MLRNGSKPENINNILIYNHLRGVESFIISAGTMLSFKNTIIVLAIILILLLALDLPVAR